MVEPFLPAIALRANPEKPAYLMGLSKRKVQEVQDEVKGLDPYLAWVVAEAGLAIKKACGQ